MKKIGLILILSLMMSSCVWGINTENWISKLDDNRSASSVSIPFSHDTLCWKDNLKYRGIASDVVVDLAITQDVDIKTQFENGARGFDLRVYWENRNNEIGIAHGANNGFTSGCWFESSKQFPEVFVELFNLLEDHPTEYIFVRLAIERDITKDQAQKYVDRVNELISEYKDRIFVFNGTEPSVGELRGKMVIIPTVLSTKGHLANGYIDPWLNAGLSADEFYTYDLSGVYDTGRIIEHFIKTNNSVNGFSFSESNVPCNAQFPFIETPRHLAENQQRILDDWIKEQDDSLRRIGCVNVDFISSECKLVKDIININF